MYENDAHVENWGQVKLSPMKDTKQTAEVADVELPPTINTLMTRKIMSIANVGGYTQNVLGKILTVIDAVIPNPKQAKAVKDVIKNDVWSAYRYLQDWGFEESETDLSPFPYDFEPEEQFRHFPDKP